MFVGEGNDGRFYGKDLFRRGSKIVPVGDGQADAIDGDGALWNDVTRERLRNFHSVPPIVTFRFEARYTAHSVDVSQDKVSAKFFTGGEGLFEIDAHAGFQFPERSFADGLAGEICAEVFVILRDDSEAATVYRDAVGDGEMRSNTGGMDGEASAIGVELQGFDGTQMLDDAGKHETSLRLQHCAAGRGDLHRQTWTNQDNAFRD